MFWQRVTVSERLDKLEKDFSNLCRDLECLPKNLEESLRRTRAFRKFEAMDSEMINTRLTRIEESLKSLENWRENAVPLEQELERLKE